MLLPGVIILLSIYSDVADAARRSQGVERDEQREIIALQKEYIKQRLLRELKLSRPPRFKPTQAQIRRASQLVGRGSESPRRRLIVHGSRSRIPRTLPIENADTDHEMEETKYVMTLPTLLPFTSAAVISTEMLDRVFENLYGVQADGELRDRIVSQCATITDEKQMRVCIMGEQHRLDIKESLERELKVKPTVRRANHINNEQLRSVLNKEGFSEEGFPLEEEEVKRQVLQAKADPPNMVKDEQRSWFNITYSEADLQSAVVYFFVTGLHNQRAHKRYSINIYKYISETDVDADPFITYHRKRSHFPPEGEWEQADITQIVDEWKNEPENNFGIMIKVIADEDKQAHDHVLRDDGENKVYLEMKSKRMISERKRRHSFNYSRENLTSCDSSPSKHCCRYSLHIDFLEFGWDWILAPRGYNAYYCAGQCVPGMANKIQHAMLAEGKGATLCCAPDNVADMRVVFIDDEGLVHSRIVPNMIVQRCGCS